MTGRPARRSGWGFGVVIVPAVSLLALGPMLALSAGTAAAAGPEVTVTPAPSNGQYHDGQIVSVSVGPNSVFTPRVRVNIIECADPGGTVANLPTSFVDCDGNTIQADSVIVQSDGSFTEKAYTLYAVPSAALGESPTNLPVCSATSACVLFVGEDQNDFSKPKVFSQPFTITPSAETSVVQPGGTGASGTTGGEPASGGTASGATSADASADVSLPAASLAFTGMPTGAPLIVALGIGLVGLGIIGRRAARRWGR